MILETVRVSELETNCYILASSSSRGALIIDPGDDAQKIKKVLDRHKLKPAFIVNTHGHMDHIGADDAFGVPVYIHSKDAELLMNPALNLSGMFASPVSINSKVHKVKEGDILELDDIKLQVIHLPGHTPGGIALLMKEPADNILFTGDSLFYKGIGRSDFPGSDGRLLVRSIKEKLLGLNEDIIVYPGHGPSTTIGEEKSNNQFLR